MARVLLSSPSIQFPSVRVEKKEKKHSYMLFSQTLDPTICHIWSSYVFFMFMLFLCFHFRIRDISMTGDCFIHGRHLSSRANKHVAEYFVVVSIKAVNAQRGGGDQRQKTRSHYENENSDQRVRFDCVFYPDFELTGFHEMSFGKYKRWWMEVDIDKIVHRWWEWTWTGKKRSSY